MWCPFLKWITTVVDFWWWCCSRMLKLMVAVAMCLFWTKLHPGQRDTFPLTAPPPNGLVIGCVLKMRLLTTSRPESDAVRTGRNCRPCDYSLCGRSDLSACSRETHKPSWIPVQTDSKTLCFLLCTLSTHTLIGAIQEVSESISMNKLFLTITFQATCCFMQKLDEAPKFS